MCFIQKYYPKNTEKRDEYIEQTTNRTCPAAKKWALGRAVRLPKGTQEHLWYNTRGGITAVGRNYRIDRKRKLHSAKPAHADFLAEGMAACLCQTDFTTSNIHKL